MMAGRALLTGEARGRDETRLVAKDERAVLRPWGSIPPDPAHPK